MGLFEIGSLHNLHFGDEDLTATIIYNDGEIAVAGTAYSAELSDTYYDIEYRNEFLMTREEITAFVPDIEVDGKYNSYVAIDPKSGCLIEAHEWVVEGEVGELDAMLPEEMSSTPKNDEDI